MLPVKPPTYSAPVVYQYCIDGIRDERRAERLRALRSSVESAAVRYENAGVNSEFHALNGSDFRPDSDVDHAELQWLYNVRMVGGPPAARKIYDDLKLAATQCPLCAHREVATIDHYLAKSSFSFLSIVPMNLIPTCSDCNKAKGSIFPSNPDEQLLHPYFDNVSSDCWLKAEIVETEPVTLIYSVSAPNSWPTRLTARVIHHFELFQLAPLYGVQAARELAGMKASMIRVYRTGGGSAVSDHLQDSADSYSEYQLNGWKAAMFRCLARSPEYYEEALSVALLIRN
jgi:hypothetical protein